jgi:hypothetical protein
MSKIKTPAGHTVGAALQDEPLKAFDAGFKRGYHEAILDAEVLVRDARDDILTSFGCLLDKHAPGAKLSD